MMIMIDVFFWFLWARNTHTCFMFIAVLSKFMYFCNSNTTRLVYPVIRFVCFHVAEVNMRALRCSRRYRIKNNFQNSIQRYCCIQYFCCCYCCLHGGGRGRLYVPYTDHDFNEFHALSYIPSSK